MGLGGSGNRHHTRQVWARCAWGKHHLTRPAFARSGLVLFESLVFLLCNGTCHVGLGWQGWPGQCSSPPFVQVPNGVAIVCR